ncbi:Hypothetical protein NTJ_10141 [Nesidiocoris tenuis]|uniref:Uncharacterized protein n=1 Tax=Nesidiocoris tenuis TaxID=355587 RepID=A0ABN7B3M1_9HEMI|nr:Hypothetical protein NTJ_10141 [Nesidiocoris tenuis]
MVRDVRMVGRPHLTLRVAPPSGRSHYGAPPAIGPHHVPDTPSAARSPPHARPIRCRVAFSAARVAPPIRFIDKSRGN